MSRSPVLAFAVAVATVVATTATAAERLDKPICKRYSCRTLSQTPHVRLFRAFKLYPYGGEALYRGTYAQWRGHRRTTPLGDQFPEDEVPSIFTLDSHKVAGRFLAYVLITYGKYNGEGFTVTVNRMDVRAGRVDEARGSLMGGEKGGTLSTPCDGGISEESPGVTDLTVNADGTAAWIIGALPEPYYSPNRSHVSIYTVCELPAGSRTPVVLASDSAISPGSLATSVGRIYWTEHGQPRSEDTLGLRRTAQSSK